MKAEEAAVLVRKELESIKKRDVFMSPTPHVVLEIIVRLGNVKVEDLELPLPKFIRKTVEDLVAKNPQYAPYKLEPDVRGHLAAS